MSIKNNTNNDSSNCDEPPDLEKQQLHPDVSSDAVASIPDSETTAPPPLLTVVVSEPPAPASTADSSKEVHHSRSSSAQEQCR